MHVFMVSALRWAEVFWNELLAPSCPRKSVFVLQKTIMKKHLHPALWLVTRETALAWISCFSGFRGFNCSCCGNCSVQHVTDRTIKILKRYAQMLANSYALENTPNWKTRTPGLQIAQKLRPDAIWPQIGFQHSRTSLMSLSRMCHCHNDVS